MNTRVKLNIRGIRELLKSQPIQSDLTARAWRIAKAAGPGFEAVTKPHKYTSRAFAQTTDEASRKAEAETKALTRALDAGR